MTEWSSYFLLTRRVREFGREDTSRGRERKTFQPASSVDSSREGLTIREICIQWANKRKTNARRKNFLPHRHSLTQSVVVVFLRPPMRRRKNPSVSVWVLVCLSCVYVVRSHFVSLPFPLGSSLPFLIPYEWKGTISFRRCTEEQANKEMTAR